MLKEYQEKQPMFYDFINKAIANNKISHAYLIEKNNVSYAYDLAISLAKTFLCEKKSCNDCNICNLIDINNYLDLKIVDNTNLNIKKEQMVDIQNICSSKPLYGKYMIYIITNAELLTASSANTILKFLEEPPENVIAILLTNNIYNVIDTIISRCQILSLVGDDINLKTLFLPLVSKNKDNNIDVYIKNQTKKYIEFYTNLEQNKAKLIAFLNYDDFKDEFSYLLQFGLYLYFDILNNYLNRNDKIIIGYEDEKKNIMKNNGISDIIYKIDLINQFINLNNYNVNKDLIIDNFIISISKVEV